MGCRGLAPSRQRLASAPTCFKYRSTTQPRGDPDTMQPCSQHVRAAVRPIWFVAWSFSKNTRERGILKARQNDAPHARTMDEWPDGSFVTAHVGSSDGGRRDCASHASQIAPMPYHPVPSVRNGGWLQPQAQQFLPYPAALSPNRARRVLLRQLSPIAGAPPPYESCEPAVHTTASPSMSFRMAHLCPLDDPLPGISRSVNLELASLPRSPEDLTSVNARDELISQSFVPMSPACRNSAELPASRMARLLLERVVARHPSNESASERRSSSYSPARATVDEDAAGEGQSSQTESAFLGKAPSSFRQKRGLPTAAAHSPARSSPSPHPRIMVDEIMRPAVSAMACSAPDSYSCSEPPYDSPQERLTSRAMLRVPTAGRPTSLTKSASCILARPTPIRIGNSENDYTLKQCLALEWED